MIEPKVLTAQEGLNNPNLDCSVLMYETWSGQNDYALQLAEALREQGLNLNLVSTENSMEGIYSGPHWKIILGDYTSDGQFMKLVKHLFGWVRIIRLIKKTKPDIIHFQTLRLLYLDWIFFKIIRHLHCKMIFTVHNSENHEVNKFEQMVLDRIYKLCDVLFVQTEFSKKALLQRIDIDANRIHLVPRGTVLWKYDEIAEPTSLHDPRQFWNYNHDDEVVLMFGLVRAYKGADLLIKSLALLKDKRPKLRVLVAGACHDKKLIKSYQDLARQLDVEGLVRFKIERIDDSLVASLFRVADLIALPYRRIDQSAVLVTAYSHQKPVIVSDTGGFLENVIDEVTGYFFKTGDTEDLAKKIDMSFNQPEKLRQMGQNALAFAQSNYLWQTTAKATLNGYGAAITEQRLELTSGNG
jgi:glycosyltransferase involved in cell wall biosynthesis